MTEGCLWLSTGWHALSMHYLVTQIELTMARLQKNSLLNALQGTLGEELIFKQYAHGTVVSKFPDMSRVNASPPQKVQRNLFKEADAYAKEVIRDPVRKAAYEKLLQPGQRAYNKALQAYMKGWAAAFENGLLSSTKENGL